MATNYITMDAAGHLVVPDELRQALQIEPGAKFEVSHDGERIILEPVKQDLIERLHGCTKGMKLGELWESIHREDKSREGL
jgi:AbrB family looped-hinge helix DNA binding protein